jgi:ABC-type transporter Mla subunit MlaD
MPATRKTTRKATPATRDRQQDNAAAIERAREALASAQDAMSSLRGDLGAGARDLRKDVSRLIRDARRDAGKMSRAVQRDLDRLQKALTARPSGKPARRRSTGSASSRSTATSR